MNDIFISYARTDLKRVRPIHDALVQRGFSVVWDQEVPVGREWDDWIRQRLSESRCVIVVWSADSIRSSNVKHEAFIAREQNKLIPVQISVIAPADFPLGLYTTQAAALTDWGGEVTNSEWRRLVEQIESVLAPPFIAAKLEALETDLRRERARRDEAERQANVLREENRARERSGQFSAPRASAPTIDVFGGTQAADAPTRTSMRVRLSLTEFTILWTAIAGVVWSLAWVIGLTHLGPVMEDYPGLTLWITGLLGGLCTSATFFFRTPAIGLVRLVGLTFGWTVAMAVGGGILSTSIYSGKFVINGVEADHLALNIDAVIIAALASACAASAVIAIFLRWTTRFIGWPRAASIAVAWALSIVAVMVLTYWRTPPEGLAASMFLGPVGALISGAAQAFTIVTYREPRDVAAPDVQTA